MGSGLGLRFRSICLAIGLAPAVLATACSNSGDRTDGTETAQAPSIDTSQARSEIESAYRLISEEITDPCVDEACLSDPVEFKIGDRVAVAFVGTEQPIPGAPPRSMAHQPLPFSRLALRDGENSSRDCPSVERNLDEVTGAAVETIQGDCFVQGVEITGVWKESTLETTTRKAVEISADRFGVRRDEGRRRFSYAFYGNGLMDEQKSPGGGFEISKSSDIRLSQDDGEQVPASRGELRASGDSTTSSVNYTLEVMGEFMRSFAQAMRPDTFQDLPGSEPVHIEADLQAQHSGGGILLSFTIVVWDDLYRLTFRSDGVQVNRAACTNEPVRGTVDVFGTLSAGDVSGVIAYAPDCDGCAPLDLFGQPAGEVCAPRP
ncbi:MAG: hypothetical protein HYY13_10030 [Nitrospirae bacterium]|nr:hypothetical protein [Nitrospirota bacterium]